MSFQQLKVFVQKWYPHASILFGFVAILWSTAFIRGQRVANLDAWMKESENDRKGIRDFMLAAVAASENDRKALHQTDSEALKAATARFELLSVNVAEIKGTLSQVDQNVTRLLNQRTQAAMRGDNTVTMRATPAGTANQ